MPRLNLATLTAEEVQHLLGTEAAQRLMPELSGARLSGKTHLGPSVSSDLTFDPLGEQDWGATPEQSRALRSHDQELLALGAAPLGVYFSPGLPEARYQRAYLWESDVALSLRWSEAPSGPARPPFLQAVTLTRDRASGIAASLSSTSGLPFAPASSEEVDVRLLPGLGAEEFLAAHRALVIRHGKGQKLNGEADWQRAYQAVRSLNYSAWQRRGLLVDD